MSYARSLILKDIRYRLLGGESLESILEDYFKNELDKLEKEWSDRIVEINS